MKIAESGRFLQLEFTGLANTIDDTGSGVEINWLETGRTGGDPQPPCVHWRSTAMGKT